MQLIIDSPADYFLNELINHLGKTQNVQTQTQNVMFYDVCFVWPTIQNLQILREWYHIKNRSCSNSWMLWLMSDRIYYQSWCWYIFCKRLFCSLYRAEVIWMKTNVSKCFSSNTCIWTILKGLLGLSQNDDVGK